ncbi:MAG: transporter substrate-binding domain-containing protein [Fretibacterium sp.]|nr:transporter substrate-binding domain-containing protein [Fretibacterium sp.]
MQNLKRTFLGIALVTALFFGALPAGATEKLSKVEQLKTEKLAAQRGTVGQMLAEELLGENSGLLLTTYEKYVDAIAALRQQKVRAVIMDEGPAKRFLANVPGLAIMPEPLSEESYAIGFKKGNDALRSRVDEALEAMKQDGTLQAIIDKYNDNIDVNPEDIDLNVGAAGGKLVMGTEAGFAPYELKVGEGYIGIDIEMAAAIARRLGMELQIENLNFDALPMAVASGKVDMICAGISVTEERKKNMDFSINYVDGAKQVAVVRADDLSE